MAALITKRIITDVIPTNIGEGEASIGQRIDEVIYAALREGRVLASISFEVEEDEWHKMERMMVEKDHSFPIPNKTKPAR